MKCPHCVTELKISERKNIEIDYCPQCRGVWLDRGELDKLLESSSRDHSDRYEDDNEKRKHYKGHSYRRKSILSEIFDF